MKRGSRGSMGSMGSVGPVGSWGSDVSASSHARASSHVATSHVRGAASHVRGAASYVGAPNNWSLSTVEAASTTIPPPSPPASSAPSTPVCTHWTVGSHNYWGPPTVVPEDTVGSLSSKRAYPSAGEISAVAFVVGLDLPLVAQILLHELPSICQLFGPVPILVVLIAGSAQRSLGSGSADTPAATLAAPILPTGFALGSSSTSPFHRFLGPAVFHPPCIPWLDIVAPPVLPSRLGVPVLVRRMPPLLFPSSCRRGRIGFRVGRPVLVVFIGFSQGR